MSKGLEQWERDGLGPPPLLFVRAVFCAGLVLEWVAILSALYGDWGWFSVCQLLAIITGISYWYLRTLRRE